MALWHEGPHRSRCGFGTGTHRAGTSGRVGDVTEGNSLLHGQETDAFGDAGYQGIDKRPDAKSNVTWHIAMKPGKRRALSKDKASNVLVNQLEKLKAGIRAKLEHPFSTQRVTFCRPPLDKIYY